MKIAIINGPNLNRLGSRQVDIYGTTSMEQVLLNLQRTFPDVHFTYRQSNHEGDLIDWIQEFSPAPYTEGAEPYDGIILNAGGYSHTSVALRDAVENCHIPVAEVHISDISQREEFRRHSLLSDVCTYSIIGHGVEGYEEAVYLVHGAQCTMHGDDARCTMHGDGAQCTMHNAR